MGRFCSYLLPYCPGKMAELSQHEVVTDQMGHPVSKPLTHNRRQNMFVAVITVNVSSLPFCGTDNVWLSLGPHVSEGEDHVPSSKMQEITVVVVFGPTKNKWMTLP